MSWVVRSASDRARRSGEAEAMMRVVIQQPQSLRRDVVMMALVLVLGLLTLAVLLLPGMVG